jgi:hypothetical protein
VALGVCREYASGEAVRFCNLQGEEMKPANHAFIIAQIPPSARFFCRLGNGSESLFP